jgi:hypothetical protein
MERKRNPGRAPRITLALHAGNRTTQYRCAETNHDAAMIRAECHTVDNKYVVEFDATPWFEQADAESIVNLAGRDWSAPWIADALEPRAEYAQLHELLQYARERLQRESIEDPTWLNFECRINDSDALAWLARNRPELVQRIQTKR